jgi:hypothetical protein
VQASFRPIGHFTSLAPAEDPPRTLLGKLHRTLSAAQLFREAVVNKT